MAFNSILHEKCHEMVAVHGAFMQNRFGIPPAMHATLVNVLYQAVEPIGLIPDGTYDSVFMARDTVSNRVYSYTQHVNRYFISVLMDAMLRAKRVDPPMINAVSAEFMGKECLVPVVRSIYRRFHKGRIPSAYELENIGANALSLMFGSSDQVIPFIPTGSLKTTDEYRSFSLRDRMDSARYRRFSGSINGTRMSFFAKENAVDEWNGSQWRILMKNSHGELQLSNSKSYNLPRLCVRIATSRFTFIEMGGLSNRHCEVITEDKLSRDIRRPEKDRGEFPWEAFFQSGKCSKLEENVLRSAQIDIINLERAEMCGINLSWWLETKHRAETKAKKWYDEIGVDLD